MATDTTDSPISGALRNQANDDRLIQKKLRKTRWQLKIAELAAACMLFAAGSIAFLLLMAVIDHWVIGLSFSLRLVALLAFLGSAGYYFWTVILPLLWRTISPVYAARMIEQGQPALKNGLINFLLLKQEGTPVHRAVLETVQHRAASDLQQYATETTVDFSKAIRVGYVFAAVALAFGVYKIASPKDPLSTVQRVISPWADIARPARVDIVEVTPGDVQIYQGQTVDVAVKVYNIDDDEQVALYFSSADRRIVDQHVELQPDESGLHFRGVIAPAGQGIQHDLVYHIQAGDATTRDYRITAAPAPSIEVVNVRYDYPSYTQETPYTQDREGAIKALEGTRVTVKAVSNLPMDEAYIEFDPDAGDRSNRQRTKLNVDSEDPTQATGTFVLELQRQRSPDDPNAIQATPVHRRYQLRFKTADGDLNPYPVAYPIDVIRDLSPEVELLRPTEEKIQVPANGGVSLEYRAIDPDYAVRQLTVIGEVDGDERFRAPLLRQSTTGNVLESFRFVPSERKLQPGEVVVAYAIAEDNRTDAAGRPTPNVTQSRALKIEITEPEQGAEKQIPPKQQGDQPQDGPPQKGDQNGEPMNQGQDQPQGGEQQNEPQQGGQQQGDQPQEGQQQGQQQQGGQQGGGQQGGAPPQGEMQNGDNQQQGQQQQEGQQQQGQQGGDQQGGDPQQGEMQNGDNQQQGQQQQEGQQQQGQQGGGQQGGDPQQGGKQNGENQQGGQQQGDPQQQGGGQQGGDPQQGGMQN
ncbi:MAG: proline-rich domain-containing protein, partial [Blastopirellula sp. JB062]